MQTIPFGRTGRDVSRIGFGSWAIGSQWGALDDGGAVAALHAALDAGVTFLDTADVYGDGHSEKLIAGVLKERGGERPYVATKIGRRLPEQRVEGFTADAMTDYLDRCLKNLDTDCLDLVQLHCPPTDLYYHPEIFDRLDRLKEAGKMRDYGVSVERIEEAMKAIEYPGVVSVQIIYNAFRLRPEERFFPLARQRDVAVIARVPLASGLLSGKFKKSTEFGDEDHRKFNRDGAAFDKGETFSGVPYEVGLEAVERVRPLIGGDATMAQFALRWILMNEAVTVAIPGVRNPEQARGNAAAADLPALPDDAMREIASIYDELIRKHVHQLW